MSMTKQKAHRVLEKLRFSPRYGKELIYKFYYEDRLILTTAIPKGKGDMKVVDRFRQQIKLSRDQLAAAIKCPFGFPEYVQHLQDSGNLD